MLRAIIFTLFSTFAMTSNAGNWFPPEYKQFPFKEGDILVSQGQDGKFSITKILKVDRIDVRQGKTLNIQGKPFIAPEDDFLLIVSSSYGEAEFSSLSEAKAAAASGRWRIKIGHIPNRAPGAAEGHVLVGNRPVKSSELEGYSMWRKAFDKGEAGVF